MKIDADMQITDGTSSVARPFYFESGEGRLFGWLHTPSGELKSGLAVVICNPFGYETICAHRSLREFAEQIAAAGHPVLRFDYLGTGDSADMDPAADCIPRWKQDVIAAIEAVKGRTGVDQVCLLGIRLGALIASLVALESTAIDALALVGPVTSGKRYLRELRMVQGSGASGPHSQRHADDPPSQSQSGILEAGGFALPAASVASLAGIDLTRLEQRLAIPVLILDSDTLPAAERWKDLLAGRGTRVDYRLLPGLVEMVMTPPHFAVTPQRMIDATVQWLAASGVEPQRRSVPAVEMAAELLIDADRPGGPPVTERPVAIPGDARLFGILTEPAADVRRRGAVVLLNPGVDFHIGASRIYVSLARQWARKGYVVLRVDLAGIGDSEARPGCAKDNPFPDEALDDVRVVMAFLRARYAVRDITLAGLCSGGYHALRAAVAGIDVRAIVLLNPQSFFWKKGMSLKEVTIAEVVHNPGVYRERLLSRQAWRRIFNGDVDLLRIASIYARRVLLAAEACVRAAARRLRIRLPQDLAWELNEIISRGVRVSFVFARGEPGIALLKLQAGSRFMQHGGNCRVRIIDGSDHIFSLQAPRLAMEKVMGEEIMADAEPGEAAPEGG
jgi:alpha-beta hydrolase superfamily lysophospholipase